MNLLEPSSSPFALSIAAVLGCAVAFVAGAAAHEVTHVLQTRWYDGNWDWEIRVNPTFDHDVCEGHLACGPEPYNKGAFSGEWPAYAVMAVVFFLVNWAVTPWVITRFCRGSCG